MGALGLALGISFTDSTGVGGGKFSVFFLVTEDGTPVLANGERVLLYIKN